MNANWREHGPSAHGRPVGTEPQAWRRWLAPAALLIILMAAAGGVAGQEEAPEVPEAPAAAEAPEAPAAPETAQTAEAPPSGILMHFEDAPLSAVLNHLADVAGLVIVQETAVDGRVYILAHQPVSVEEAISLLNSVLKERGFAAIRMGRTLKIVPLTEAKERNVPVRSGNDPAQIEPTDEIITQVIPIRFADAVRLREDIAPLVPSYAQLSSNASSNSLILTDTGANIRRIVEIVRALDTHMAGVAEVRVFPLTYADATAAARLINEVFQVEDQAGRAGQAGRGARQMGGPAFRRPGAEPEQPEGEGARAQRVAASADARTNTVVVSGPPDVLTVVAEVIKELDSNPAEEEGVLVYSLKNAKAANLVGVLNELFRTQTGTQGRGGTTTAQRGATQARTRGQRGGAAGGASQAATQAAGALQGQVTVVADEDTNSLIVMTSPANFDRVRAILADLDRAIPQVLIKVLIAEVSHDRTVDLGVEFSVLNLAEGERGSALFTSFGIADETDGLIYRLVRGDASAALRALEEVGKLDILSRPYILASDNQTATITVGEEVPFIRNTRTTETGQTINTIEYEDIGIILNVTPHINPDGLVIMDVSPEISAVTDSTVPISEKVDAAVFAKRSAATRVAILDGQTIVIGGLMEDRKTLTVSKVPLLGDIPLLGALFRRTTDTKVKTELLIFLTPHVAQQAELLKAMSADEMKGIKVVPGAVLPGAFDEHMQGLQRGSAKATGE